MRRGGSRAGAGALPCCAAAACQGRCLRAPRRGSSAPPPGAPRAVPREMPYMAREPQSGVFCAASPAQQAAQRGTAQAACPVADAPATGACRAGAAAALPQLGCSARTSLLLVVRARHRSRTRAPTARCSRRAPRPRAQLAVALAAPGCAVAAAAGPAAAPAPVGTCFLDSQGKPPAPVCNTAAQHNANTRGDRLTVAALLTPMLWGLLFYWRIQRETKAVFVDHAAALRAREADLAPDSAERSALEVEAADVEAAQEDWSRIQHDGAVLAAPTKTLNPNTTGYTYRTSNAALYNARARNSYTVEAKAEAAGERQALLSKHGEHAFDGVREVAYRSPECIRDGVLVTALVFALLCWMSWYFGNVLCEAPAYQLCLHSTAQTYTCAVTPTYQLCLQSSTAPAAAYTCSLAPGGACVATPLAG